MIEEKQDGMVLQEVPENKFEPELEYMEKVDDIEFDEELLEQLRAIRDTAQNDLEQREGYENYSVSNVVHYNKNVELTVLETREVEYLDLSVVVAQDMETGEIIEIYYLNGEEANIVELNSKYESALPIIEVINETNENLKLDTDKQDEELIKIELVDLEEKELEEHEERKEDKELEEKHEEEKDEKDEKEKDEEENENSLTGIKPRYMVQTIDVDKTYVDNKTTVRKAFNIPAGVQELAISKPEQGDKNVLSRDLTIFMLDSSGKVIENADGIQIGDIFELDAATGKAPNADMNTKLGLEGYAKRDISHTLRRFRSKENPDFYLSAEQKKIGDYAKVYAGRKSPEGNNPIEVELETRNVGIQTDLEMQEVVAGYKGIYNTGRIDQEVDEYEVGGNDLSKIEKENADGMENDEYEGRVPWDSGRTRR